MQRILIIEVCDATKVYPACRQAGSNSKAGLIILKTVAKIGHCPEKGNLTTSEDDRFYHVLKIISFSLAPHRPLS